MNLKVLVPSLLIVAALLLSVGVYLHQTSWLFTPAYSQRQAATTFLNDIYANKMSAAYGQTSSTFLSKNSITDFTKTETPLIGTNKKTYFAKYYIFKNHSIITGHITDLTNSSVLSLNMTFNGNKIDSVYIVKAN